MRLLKKFYFIADFWNTSFNELSQQDIDHAIEQLKYTVYKFVISLLCFLFYKIRQAFKMMDIPILICNWALIPLRNLILKVFRCFLAFFSQHFCQRREIILLKHLEQFKIKVFQQPSF